ncbi:MAG: RNA pyrophosphohydrolase [Legionellales bacterium]|nr:RNA pyrophosphohydrolase [Legionellales bacterium]
MIVDRQGFRLNVGIVLMNEQGRVFWGKRIGHDAWQFPQGGIDAKETATEAVMRELHEEIGLSPEDVDLLGITPYWLRYRLPKQYIRSGGKPKVIGQKQKWALLKLNCPEQKIRLDLSSSPEFDSWRWVDYWYPPKHVIFFKRKIYQQALQALEPVLKRELA